MFWGIDAVNCTAWGSSIESGLQTAFPTKSVLFSEKLTFVEAEIVHAKIEHRPGEIARVAYRLGEANISINYAYCGLEPGTNAPLVFFGVSDVERAVPILERAAADAAKA